MPTPGGSPFVSDGGLETDLIFQHGIDLPEFASFPLLDSEDGRGHLHEYFSGYAEVAARAGAGLALETPTWRANPDWGIRLGYDPAELDRVNRASVDFLRQIAAHRRELRDIVVAGVIGPRGDGYVPDSAAAPEVAAGYHRAQVESFAAAGADYVHAMTMTTAGEAAGIVAAANAAAMPVVISFTVETDGRLPDGSRLADAIERVDGTGDVAFFGVNCAHPDHIAPALTGGGWQARIVALRPNASTKSHAELDAAESLDEGNLPELVDSLARLRERLPNVAVIGGCCGTDVRHVAALWGVA